MRKYIISLFVLVFITSLFIPGVMAQENEKTVLLENNLINKQDVSEAKNLSEEDRLEIENIVYIMLESEGIVIENLDLNNLKMLETSEKLILDGEIKYDIKSELGDIKKNSALDRKTKIYTILNKTDISITTESTTNDQYYRMEVNKNTDSGNYNIEEKFIRDGVTNVYNSIILTNSEEDELRKNSNEFAISKASYTPIPGWNYPPSNPPSNSISAYHNAKLSSVIAGGNIVISIAAGLIGAGLGGIVGSGLSAIIVQACVSLYEDYLANLGVNSTSNAYVDFYYTIYPRPGYKANPAIGYAYPTAPIYVEIYKFYHVV